MTQRALQTREVQGLSPAIEPTQSDEVFVLRGENYVFTSKGPRSAFGDRLLTETTFLDGQAAQGHRVKLIGGDKCFYFTSTGIYDWQEATRAYRLIYDFSGILYEKSAWSLAYVNGWVFMNHPSIALLAYSVAEETIVNAASVGSGVPESVRYICANRSRVIAVTDEAYHYSAPSNGFDFAPRLGFAGFQLINDLVPGSPLGVVSYAFGTLTWTTGGLIRSEFRGDAAVYNHKAVDTQYRPINSFCMTHGANERAIILDERGLFISDGGRVEPYDPLFNEFLIEFIRENRIDIGDYARLFWDEIEQHLYVSFSYDAYDSLFDVAFVHYAPINKWGSFNRKHHAILPIDIPSGAREGAYAGFMDEQARIRYFGGINSVEQDPETDPARVFQSYIRSEQQSRPFGSHDSDCWEVSTRAPLQFGAFKGRIPGYYADPQGTTPDLGTLSGLQSSIKLGFFRGAKGVNADEMSELQYLMIRHASKLEVSPVPERADVQHASFQDMQPFETNTPIPAYGEHDALPHGVRVEGSIDGERAFTAETPIMTRLSENTRHYAFTTLGVWHSIEFYATNVGEGFAPVSITMTISMAGTL